jgi:uncharacterized membrane protein
LLKEDNIFFEPSSGIELEKAEFVRIKKLYFESFIGTNKSPTEKIIEMKQFFSKVDPPHSFEPFVDEMDVPLLWVWDNPYITAFENEFKEKLSLFRAKHIDLKRNFAKIFLEEDKNKSEINFKLFISLTKSFFGINHILIPLFKAMVFMYNRISTNYELALRELTEAENVLVYLDPSKPSKNTFAYFINLYKSYVYMKLEVWTEAEEKLNNALRFNPNGVNALFAKIILYSTLNRTDEVENALNRLLLNDLDKIKNAMKNDNLPQFYYFLQNPILPNIFNYNNLATYNKTINKVLSRHFDKKITFDNIELRINAINEINLIEYIDENYVSKLLFLNHIFSDKNSINTVYFGLLIPHIEEIFINLVENLKENVRKKYFAELYSKISDYDRRIKEFQTKKSELEVELSKAKEQAEQKMQESIKIFDESITNAITETELMLSNVDLVSKYNPFEALQNSMIYNFVISILVFLLAILSNYFNVDYSMFNKSYSLISYLIIGGIKWAAISFLVGVIISVIYSVLVFLEKASYQQNLKRKIAQLKREKEVNIEIVKKEYNKKIATLSEEYKTKINTIDKRIEELKQEKIENEKTLKERAEKNMEPIMSKINFALNPNAVVNPSDEQSNS